MAFLVFAFSLGYASLRYLVFGKDVVANLPCYIGNKAVSLFSVLALVAMAIHSRAGRANEQRKWFAFFKVALFLHVALSFFLYSPEYYPQMFSGGKMNIFGELFMLFGVIGLFLMMFRTIAKEFDVRPALLQTLSLVAIALHNLFRGVRGWPAWQDWPGTMPPITMISFLAAVVALAIQLAPAPRLKTQG